jgi:ankyrin repeat protein
MASTQAHSDLGRCFAQRKPIEEFGKISLLLSAFKKCSCDEFLITESEKYVLREVFRDFSMGQVGNDNELIWEIADFIQKNPFLIVAIMENMLKIVNEALASSSAQLSQEDDNDTLAKNLAKDLAHLRQRRFVKDMNGRNSRERSSLARNHICAANELKPLVNKLTIDFSTVDATFVDFTNLDLSAVQFGRNSIEGSLFRGSNITVKQLKDVKSFENTEFDEEFAVEFYSSREKDFQFALESVRTGIQEAKIFEQSFSGYYLLANRSGTFCNLKTGLSTVSDIELHSMSYMLLNDSTINPLPEGHEWHYADCNENREKFMALSRAEVIQALENMMEVRKFVLSTELLSLAIDRKLYQLQCAMDEFKERLSYYMESLDSFPSAMKEELKTASTEIYKKTKAIKEELEVKRTDNNRTRIQFYLSDLNLPPDPELEYEATDRLIECINLAKEIPNTVINLVGKELSNVKWEKIDISSGVILTMKPEDEKKLPEQLLEQRYGIMFAQARAGRLKEIDDYITLGRLDPNYQEPGSLRTALLYACSYGHFDICKLLIEKHNANINLKTAFGWNLVDVLSEATSSSTDPSLAGQEFLQYLMDRGATLNVFQAAALGNIEKLKTFPVAELHGKCPIREATVLDIAANSGNMEIIQYLIEKKIPLETSAAGSNPLWIAAERGHDAVVSLLVAARPKLAQEKCHKRTPIQAALENRHFKVVQTLYPFEPKEVSDPQLIVALSHLEAVQDMITEALQERKQNAKSKENIHQLLYYACLYGRDAIFKQVLTKCGEKIVDFNYRYKENYDRRLVDQACDLGNFHAMNLLLAYKHKFDVNDCTNVCPSLLFVALMKKNFKMVTLLLEEYKVNAKCKHIDRNMLHHLMILKGVDELERLHLAKQLISHECNVFELDKEGNSLLHYAARVSTNMMKLVQDAQMKVVSRLVRK